MTEVALKGGVAVRVAISYTERVQVGGAVQTRGSSNEKLRLLALERGGCALFRIDS